jgi:plastocyanin
MNRSNTIITTLVVAALAQVASAQGTLKGRLVFDGKAPTPAAINVDKDVAFCGAFGLKSEKLVVNPKNGGVKNVVVYLYVSARGKKPPVSAAAKKRPAEVRIDNQKCRFEPRIVAITVDQALTIGNKDSIAHNSKIDVISAANISINPIIPAGKDYKHKFNVEERLPIPISCSIHPWMNGYILIKDNPYFAVTDEDGNFEIKDLPTGEWTFRFWQENVGYVQKVKFEGKATTWKRGEKKVKIAKGKTVDLKEVKSDFKPKS